MTRIKTIQGNMLTDVTEGYMIHGCNCQGIMGSGIAKEVKERFPEAYRLYREYYEDNALLLGDIIDYWITEDLVLVNCMAQEFYGSDKRHLDYEALVKCIEEINEMALDEDIPRVLNFPKIGCGLAGGNWEIVKKIIEESAPDMDLVYWEFEG